MEPEKVEFLARMKKSDKKRVDFKHHFSEINDPEGKIRFEVHVYETILN